MTPAFRLAKQSRWSQYPDMIALRSQLLALVAFCCQAAATTITVVPIFEPLSLHGTDGDEAIMEIGEALQACVMPRPMALTGAFPEVLCESIRTPHPIPTNNPNYEVKEANLLVICQIAITAEMTEDGLRVGLDVSQLNIPEEVDLTSRQVLKLAIIAVRKTLDEYQRPQPDPIKVKLSIDGTGDAKATLRDLGVEFIVGTPPVTN